MAKDEFDARKCLLCDLLPLCLALNSFTDEEMELLKRAIDNASPLMLLLLQVRLESAASLMDNDPEAYEQASHGGNLPLN